MSMHHGVSLDAAERLPIYASGELRGHALVDPEDAGLARYRWRLNRTTGYVVRTVPGRQRCAYLHREVMCLAEGDGKYVDHINGDKLDNRRSNLRAGPQSLNGQNIVRTGGSSSYRGVSWATVPGKWLAQAHLAGKSYFLGYFDDERKAADAARAFRAQHMPFANEERVA